MRVWKMRLCCVLWLYEDIETWCSISKFSPGRGAHWKLGPNVPSSPFHLDTPWFLKAGTGWERGGAIAPPTGVLGSPAALRKDSPSPPPSLVLELCLQAGWTQSGNDKGWRVLSKGLWLSHCHLPGPLESSQGWDRVPCPASHTFVSWCL